MYAQRVAGYSALAAGLAFLPSSLVISFVASPLTMPIVRRIGVRAMGFATSALMVVGETILLFLHPATPYWLGLFPATMIGGFGGMLAYQAGMIAGLGHVDDADEGSASAALSFALQLGIGFGVALGASAQELRTQTLLQTGVASSQAFAGGLQAAFWVCVAIGIANIVSIAGIRHAATAELPLRRYLPFGRLHHRVAARTP
jgi:Na+/melibiose symporter-like transporter